MTLPPTPDGWKEAGPEFTALVVQLVRQGAEDDMTLPELVAAVAMGGAIMTGRDTDGVKERTLGGLADAERLIAAMPFGLRVGEMREFVS